MWQPIALLIVSNTFMTFAWYGHLKDLKTAPLWVAVFISWFIAFFEYCAQVPANRMGAQIYSLPQLKVIQEIITMVVFAVFASYYMNVPITKNFIWAGVCLIGAAYFMFKDAAPV